MYESIECSWSVFSMLASRLVPFSQSDQKDSPIVSTRERSFRPRRNSCGGTHMCQAVQGCSKASQHLTLCCACASAAVLLRAVFARTHWIHVLCSIHAEAVNLVGVAQPVHPAVQRLGHVRV